RPHVGDGRRGAALAPGHDARRAPELVRGRAPVGSHAPRPGGRGAGPAPTKCLPRAYRSRGRERHPPGRAGRTLPGGRMSIRGGRGPRDDQDDAGNYRNGYHRTGRYRRGPGDQRKYERYGSRNGGIGGILRFIVFLGLLAGGVLLVMVTVAR